MLGLAYLYIIARKVRRRLLMHLLRSCFRKSGKNFRFDPDGHYSFDTISVGNNVFVGPRAYINSPLSTISLGDGVMIGPDVMIIGGDHNTSEVGKAMCDVITKRPQDDLPVVIEDDVWVGAGAIILKGVRISRGSIVAAGTVVTKSFPPYSVIGGVPARLIRCRWDEATIRRHEELLGLRARGQFDGAYGAR